jgi:hypothetical protein
MSLFKSTLALLVLSAASMSALADSPCGPGRHIGADNKCADDLTTLPLAQNPVSEFGAAAPSAATSQAPEDVHRAKSDFEAKAEMEKERYEYLQAKRKADALDSSLSQSTTRTSPQQPVAIYLTMISGTDDDLTGTVIYDNQIWRVKNGTTLGSSVVITELHKTYAVANVNGKVQLLGLSSLSAVQQAQQQHGQVQSSMAGQPAVEYQPGSAGLPSQGSPINASDLPPPPR